MSECPTCGDGFKNTTGMKTHHAQVHGESLAGVEYECDWCGKTNRKPKCHMDRQDHHFCDDDCWGPWQSARQMGEDNPNWNGGSDYFTVTPAGKAWRKAVFQRDNYTCQDCGDDSGGNLQAHHKKKRSEHPDLKYMVWNGVTLCLRCHAERHKGEQIYEAMLSRLEDE